MRERKSAGARAREDDACYRRVDAALRDVRRGKMVILTDDEDRENEGDLVMAAEKVTPASINFMAVHARGLICLAMTEERIRQLQLPLMVQDNQSPFQTAFTVSIEAARGVTTGISAADRARTVLAAVAPKARPSDLVRPGHVFPLRARDGGVLVRTGQTEGSVDLARLAGLSPAGVICEIMNADGTMSRRPALLRFARKHRLTLLSVADIIRYRLRHDRLVRRVGQSVIRRPGHQEFQTYAYVSDVDQVVHLAMVKGEVQGGAPVLTRVHRVCVPGELLGDTACKCRSHLDSALRMISEEGTGVLIYLQKETSPEERLRCANVAAPSMGRHLQMADQFREFGLGAQILRDLGLRRLRLLTGSNKKIVGLQSYGLEITERISLSPRGRRAT